MVGKTKPATAHGMKDIYSHDMHYRLSAWGAWAHNHRLVKMPTNTIAGMINRRRDDHVEVPVRNVGDDLTPEFHAIERAIAKMRGDQDPRQRKLIMRYYLSHMNHQQVADRLKISEAECKRLHLRALGTCSRYFHAETLHNQSGENRIARVLRVVRSP